LADLTDKNDERYEHFDALPRDHDKQRELMQLAVKTSGYTEVSITRPKKSISGLILHR
jgi:hypothetical protein